MYHRTFNKAISILITVTFLFTNTTYAVPNSRQLFQNKKVDYKKLSTQSEERLQQKKAIFQDEEVEERKKQARAMLTSHLKDLSQIHIPSEIGRVIEVYDASSNAQRTTHDAQRLIVHIQDLHTNPEAQYNLANILELLLKDYNLDLVCSEGADGVVDTSNVSSFPDYEVRKNVSKLFVDSGELTGEEYLSITKYPDLPIWGIEDRAIYFQNIIEFNKIMKYNPQSQIFISQCSKALEGFKNTVYTKELLNLDQKETDYENEKLKTDEYLKYLTSYIQKFNIPTQKYKNITLLKESIDQESKIDNAKVMQDSQNLLLNLQVELSKNNLDATLDSLKVKADLFRDQKISSFSFYSYLKDLALKHMPDKVANYPNLNEFIDYLTKVNSLDSTKLFNEMEDLSYEVNQLLAKTQAQKDLITALRNIKFLEGFFNLKVSNEELDYYLANREKFKVSWFKSVITDLRTTQNAQRTTQYIDYNPALIDGHLQELEDFYKTVKERDIEMVNNAISEIENRNAKVATLIAGGFHTKGITRMLREQGYSYIVVSPYSSTDIDEENYHNLLTGKRKTLVELLEELDLSEIVNRLSPSLRIPLALDLDLQQALNETIVASIAEISGVPKEELISDNTADKIGVLMAFCRNAERWEKPIVVVSGKYDKEEKKIIAKIEPKKGEPLYIKFDKDSAIEVQPKDYESLRTIPVIEIGPFTVPATKVADAKPGIDVPTGDGTMFDGGVEEDISGDKFAQWGKWGPKFVSKDDLNLDMFRDYDYRSTGPVLKPEVVFRFGLVWANMALEKARNAGIENRKVLIARDARKIEPELVEALASALRYRGLDVIYVAADGPNAVTSYSWAVQEHKPLMSIFVTASHVSRPKGEIIRGFKVAMLDKKGGNLQSMTTKEIKQVSKARIIDLIENPHKIQTEESAQKGKFIPSNIDSNCVRMCSLVGRTVDSGNSLYKLAREIEASESAVDVLYKWEQQIGPSVPLRGMKVVVEGAHTPSGKLAADTFKELGAEVVLINGDVQEIEGEHKADPSKEVNLAELKETIIRVNADFGIAFDLDGDRLAIVVLKRSSTTSEVTFQTLPPDNLLVALLPYLIKRCGYNAEDIGKKVGVIRDVLGTFGVNDMAERLGIEMFQTDAGYVFLKARRQVLLDEGYAIPIYGERSGHCWLDVTGEFENPISVAVLFATMVKEAKYKEDNTTDSINPFLDAFIENTIPYEQSERFQPLFHQAYLSQLSSDPRNDTGWIYNMQEPTKPPQAIIALGKDTGVKRLQEEFVVGKEFETPAGRMKVREFNTYQDPPDEGGLYRFADIVFELDGKFAGRFVFRASSNDPTFVCSFETPVWEGEDYSSATVQDRYIFVGGVVLDWLEKNEIARVTGKMTAEELKLYANKESTEKTVLGYRKKQDVLRKEGLNRVKDSMVLLKMDDGALVAARSADLKGLPGEFQEPAFAGMLIRHNIMNELLEFLGVDELIQRRDFQMLIDATRASNYPGMSAFERLNKNTLHDIEVTLAREDEIGRVVDKAVGDDKIDTMLILGMGGSGIAPEVMEGFVRKIYGRLPIAITIVKDATIPQDVTIDEHTLVIANTYSGTTGETLSALQDAINKGAGHILGVSTNDKELKKIAGDDLAFVQLPVGEKIQPREAYNFAVPINLEIMGWLLARQKDFQLLDIVRAPEAIGKIEEFIAKNPEWDTVSRKILERGLKEGKSLLFIYEDDDPILAAVAERAFQQNSECYKQVGHSVVDSKDITVESLRDNFIPIIIKNSDKKTHSEQNLASLNPIVIGRQTENEFANTFILELILTRAIYGLASFNGIDPMPVSVIAKFKAIMNDIVARAEGITEVKGDEYEDKLSENLRPREYTYDEIVKHVGNTTPIIIGTEETSGDAKLLGDRLFRDRGVMPIVWRSPEAWHNAINGVFPFAYGKNFSIVILERGTEKGFSKVQQDVVKENFLKPFEPLVVKKAPDMQLDTLEKLLKDAEAGDSGALQYLQDYGREYPKTLEARVDQLEMERQPKGGGIEPEDLARKIELKQRGDKESAEVLDKYAEDNTRLYIIQVRNLMTDSMLERDWKSALRFIEELEEVESKYNFVWKGPGKVDALRPEILSHFYAFLADEIMKDGELRYEFELLLGDDLRNEHVVIIARDKEQADRVGAFEPIKLGLKDERIDILIAGQDSLQGYHIESIKGSFEFTEYGFGKFDKILGVRLDNAYIKNPILTRAIISGV